MRSLFIAFTAVVAGTVLATAAEQVGTNRVINDFPEGSISVEEGLDSWAKFYEVASHPRCSNCHVGADNRPMWSGPPTEGHGRTA